MGNMSDRDTSIIVPEPELYESTCENCQKVFRETLAEIETRDASRAFFLSLSIKNFKYPVTCKECVAASVALIESQRLATELVEWKRKNIPPLYREINLSHPDLPGDALALVQAWNFKRGIGLIGTSGRCKTRLLYFALVRAKENGYQCSAITHNHFSVMVIDAFASDYREEKKSAKSRLEWLRNVDILLVDDVGKAPRTERADAEFEELIEQRVSHNRPILWTANAGGAWLESRFGEDRGPALVRRLAQFCDCLTLR